jgi:hypothetical protein
MHHAGETDSRSAADLDHIIHPARNGEAQAVIGGLLKGNVEDRRDGFFLIRSLQNA